MKQETTNQQALIALYSASQRAQLTKSEHDYLLECAKQLEALVAPEKKEEKEEKSK